MISQLKEARLEAGYSLDQVAKELRIRKQYLEAIEEDNFDILPGKVYIDGYTKLYAKFLGITIDYELNNNEEQKFPYNKIVSNKNFKKYLVIISVAMLILIVTIYQLILQPNLSLDTMSVIENNYDNNINYTNESNK